jgi:uncharacterized membrane protein YgaE (UPF0421/DUF939 family)
MDKHQWIKGIKIAFGCAIAIVLAKLLGLEHATSCGIVTLLTIQDTKLDTLRLSLQRILSFGVSMLAGYLISFIPTHHTIHFFLYLLVVVEVSYVLKWDSAISTNAVFGTHVFFTESVVNTEFVENEFSLLIIGMVIAIIMNWKMPNMEGGIREKMRYVEDGLKTVFVNIAEQLEGATEKSVGTDVALDELVQCANAAIDEAIKNINNTFAEHAYFYTSYFRMRRSQCLILQSVNRSLRQLDMEFEPLPRLLREMSGTISAKNSPDLRLEQLAKVAQEFEALPMPRTKAELESRAFVYYMLKELEGFLRLKQKFYNDLSEEEKRLYLV